MSVTPTYVSKSTEVSMTNATKSNEVGTPSNVGGLIGILGLTVGSTTAPIPTEIAKSSYVSPTYINKS